MTTNSLQPLISRKQAAPAADNFLVILSGAQAESKNLVEVAASRDHSTTLRYTLLPLTTLGQPCHVEHSEAESSVAIKPKAE